MSENVSGKTSDILPLRNAQASLSTCRVHAVVCHVCGSSSGSVLFSAPDRLHGRFVPYRLIRCQSCSLVWLEDPPKIEEMPSHYGRDYHEAISTAGETDVEKGWKNPIRAMSKFVQRGTLLDIGCSTGGFLQSVKGSNWKLYGIEVSPEEAQRARVRSGAEVFVGDILDAPFPASTFDVITGFHVLEHLYEPKEIIRMLWSWLKPGGVLYLHVPNIASLEARIFRSYWYGLELPRHLYHYSPTSLDCLFAYFDFEKLLFRTLPHNHIEPSIYYVINDLKMKCGISTLPLAEKKDVRTGLVWRVVRKAIRVGIFRPFGFIAALAGLGAGIELAFRKRLP